MDLISMKVANQSEPKETEIDKPEYPYGLSINLDNESLKKLGMEELPQVGDTMMVMAKVEVRSVSSYDTTEGDDKNVSLQITEMVAKPKEGKSLAEKMYGSNNDE